MVLTKGIIYDIDKKGLKKAPTILGNPLKLKEVFVNIINNAVDAMPDGGRISFRTWRKNGSVFISISDTGKGMSEDVQKRVFDPFFTTRRPKGTGLGMSVSYGIIKRHGGEIDVESKSGKGSTFTLKFPINREKARTTESSKPTKQKKAKNLNILVVDDDIKICRILNKFLSKEGHNVRSVDSGDEAIKLLKSEVFDLVLCDLIMPMVTGYDIIRFLNMLDKRPKVGVITGWGEEIGPRMKEDIKVDFVIKKPFDITEISGHINDLFNAE